MYSFVADDRCEILELSVFPITCRLSILQLPVKLVSEIVKSRAQVQNGLQESEKREEINLWR